MNEDNLPEEEEKNGYDELLSSWLEYMNMLAGMSPIIPSFGMIQTYRKRFVEMAKGFSDIAKSISTFNKYLPLYYQKIGATWLEATKKAILKCQQENIEDSEKIKQVWLDTLEIEFAELFNSDEFGALAGKLLDSESQINKEMHRIAEIYSKSLNIPTRSELDDIYAEITKMKRNIKKLSDKLDTLTRMERHAEQIR